MATIARHRLPIGQPSVEVEHAPELDQGRWRGLALVHVLGDDTEEGDVTGNLARGDHRLQFHVGRRLVAGDASEQAKDDQHRCTS